MPSPSGPNAYPSGPANYPFAPDQWAAAAALTSPSKLTLPAAGLTAASRATLTATSSLTATCTANRPALATLTTISRLSATAQINALAAASLLSTSSTFPDSGAPIVSVSTLVVTVSTVATSGGTLTFAATSTLVATPAGVRPVAMVTGSASALTAAAFPSLGASAAMASASSLTADGRHGSIVAAPLVSFSAVTVSATSWTPAFPVPTGTPVPQTRFPTLRLLFADTRTGKIAYEAPFSDVSWSCTLNGEDSSTTATLVVEEVLEAIYAQVGEDPGQVLNEFLTGPYRYSMAVCWGSSVLWAGPYLPSTDEPTSPTISIAGASLHHLLARRIIRSFSGAPTGGVGDSSRDLTMFTTPVGAAYQLVENAIYNPVAGAGRELPITCSNPPDLRGDEAFTYLSYDVLTVEKALEDLAARVDGPDFRFDPYLYQGSDGAYLAWNFVLGNPYIPTVAAVGPNGPLPWVWDDRNSLVERDVDATGLATTSYTTGAGQDRDKLIVEADNNYLLNLGWPALESANSTLSSETDAYKLGQYAASIVGATTAQTWKISAPYATADPQPGLFREGDLGRIDISQHLVIPKGSYYRRITKLSGNSTEFTAEFDPDTATTV